MPDEFREHLTRDQRPFLHPESLQILQIHRSMTVLLLFSSLTHLLQGSGQRTHLLQGPGQRTGTAMIAEAWFCAQWPIWVVFEVCVWIIVRLEDPNMAHITFLTESVTCWFLYLLLFDRIHDAMCLNKMSRTSSRNIGPQHQKYSYIFNCTHGVFFILVFTKPILSVCC